MRKHLQTSLAILLAVSLALWGGYSTVIAGTGTITVKDASGSTQTYAVVTDGSGHYIAEQVICDYSAGANCASVTSSHELTVFATALGTISDAAWSSGNGTVIALLKNIANGIASAVSSLSSIATSSSTIATNSAAPIPDCGATPCTNKIGTVYPQSQYPVGAVPITISATGTVSATSVTLASATSVTTYLCGFSIRANATAAATGNATVTGTKTGTLNFTQWTAPLASGLGIVEPNLGSQCIPASAAATAIVINAAAPGTGGTISVSAWGYQQ